MKSSPILGKIDYINLLPFHIFLKKHLKSDRSKRVIESKKSYPSEVTDKFKRGSIDGAFISSVESKKYKSLNLGIIANGSVLSVMAFDGESKKDFQSKTSNRLAEVLQIDGEISIGDKALKRYFDGDIGVDLALEWKKRYNLPFVFGLFCYNRNDKFFKNMEIKFKKYLKGYRIPTYILNNYSKRSGVSKSNILYYLTKIDYIVGKKERISLKKFLSKA